MRSDCGRRDPGESLQDWFAGELLPHLRGAALRRCPRHRRWTYESEEWVQDVYAVAWDVCVRLARRGREPSAQVGLVVLWAVRGALQQRVRSQSRERGRGRRRRHPVRCLADRDGFGPAACRPITDIGSAADAVRPGRGDWLGFGVDLEAWLDVIGPTNALLVHAFAAGLSVRQAARAAGLHPTTVMRRRATLGVSWALWMDL